MKNPLLLFALAFLLVFTSSSCVRRGCTHPAAGNYNPDATKDDGSCIFPSPDDIEDIANVYIYFTGVERPTQLLINGIDYTRSLIDLPSASIDLCNKAEYANYMIRLIPYTSYTVYASNSTQEWLFSNYTFSPSFDATNCNIIGLNAGNVSNTLTKSSLVFTSNMESGMRTITIKVDDAEVAKLNEWSSGAAVKAVATIAPGRHSYTASSQNGHTWADSFTTVNGQTLQFEFTKANAIKVEGNSNLVFYSALYNNISVFINNTYMGKTTAIYNAGTSNLCTAPGVISIISKADTTYNYTATTPDGHIWSGTASANAGSGCILLNLD